MAFGCTVVSTRTRSSDGGFVASARSVASTVALRTSPMPVRANALARHRAGIDGRRVREDLKPGEMLPIGIFAPPLHYLLVGKVVNVLQVVEADHQPGWPRLPPDRLEDPAEGIIEPTPGRHPGQRRQRVARGDDVVQTFARQVGLAGGGTGRSHREAPEISGSRGDFLYFRIFGSAWEFPDFNAFGVFRTD